MGYLVDSGILLVDILENVLQPISFDPFVARFPVVHPVEVYPVCICTVFDKQICTKLGLTNLLES